jgi:hypothetical protein
MGLGKSANAISNSANAISHSANNSTNAFRTIAHVSLVVEIGQGLPNKSLGYFPCRTIPFAFAGIFPDFEKMFILKYLVKTLKMI